MWHSSVEQGSLTKRDLWSNGKVVKDIKREECLNRQKRNLVLRDMALEKASEHITYPFHQHNGLEASSAISKKKMGSGRRTNFLGQV